MIITNVMKQLHVCHEFSKNRNKRANFFTNGLQTIILISSLVISLNSITAGTPFVDFQPPEIQAGQGKFILSTTTDEDSSINFLSNYLVTLQRVKDLGPYLICIGFKSLGTDFPLQPAPGLYLHAKYDSPTSTQFYVQFYTNYELAWQFVRASYIAISKSLGKIYTFVQPINVNNVMTNAYVDSSYSDTSIAALPPSTSYVKILSIYKFDDFYEKSSIIGTRFMKIQMITISTTSYTVRLKGNGFFIQWLYVQGLLIDPALLNDRGLKTVILTKFYSYSGGNTGYVQQLVWYEQDIDFPWNNVFYGLYQFYNDHHIYYTFYIPTRGIQMIKNSTIATLSQVMLVYYQNKCNDPFIYDESSQLCVLCPEFCLKCNSTQCLQCERNFTISATKDSCVCNYQIVTGTCQDFNSTSLKGCNSAIIDSNQVNCKFCSFTQKLMIKNGECVCKSGFKFDSVKKCFEVCGDGLKQSMECDDGNQIDGDGCSSTCTFESGFDCKGTPTTCKSNVILNFVVLSIMKNEDNSATMTFKIIQEPIPFPLQIQNFQKYPNGSQKFTLKLKMQNNSYIDLKPSIKTVDTNTIQFHVYYDFTIEGMDAELFLDLSQTKYTMKETNLKFNSIGDNQPLKYSKNLSLFKTTEKGGIGLASICLVLLFAGLVAPKYIGLQGILTLQLIFYSCLLVKDASKFPIGFKMFSYLKISTGYNEIMSLTSILLNSDLISKLTFLGLKKTIIQNYNVSFIILVIVSVTFFISMLRRMSKEYKVLQDKSFINMKQKSLITQDFQQSLKINEIIYRAYDQISMWSVLQVISTISCQIMISNKDIIILKQNFLLYKGSIVMMLAIFLIALTGLNHSRNTLLSALTMGKNKERQSQMNYKQTNFIYLSVIGVMIFFFNEVQFGPIPFSVVVGIFQVIYILILWKINPYQKSLQIHSHGLFYNQFIYLLFLVFINIINFVDNIPEIVGLIIAYTVLLLVLVLIFMTIVRLYYQYRYGQELQNKIQKQKQEAQKKRKLMEQLRHKKIVKNLEEQARERLQQKQKDRFKNKYLIQTQLIEDKMAQYLNFIQKRPSLNDKQKQALYFQKYHQKPLEWLKHNDNQQFQKISNEMNLWKQAQQQKKRLKLQDSEYQKVSNRLKKQFKRYQRVQKSTKKSKLNV